MSYNKNTNQGIQIFFGNLLIIKGYCGAIIVLPLCKVRLTANQQF